jgi:hypothetical protein
MAETTIQPGQKFGRLTAISFHSQRPQGRGQPKLTWICKCTCGKRAEVTPHRLTSGHIKSCGCLQGDCRTKHTMHKAPEYRTWAHMKQRCRPDKPQYAPDYSERGITVCDEWKRDFMAFYRAVGPKPTPKHELDRIDNDKGYEPGNVRWATRAEQTRNTRSTVLITFQGITLCRTEWARKLDISVETLRARLRNWSVERALTAPISKAPLRCPHSR